jgi:uncharacterized protein (UPF0333 family)
MIDWKNNVSFELGSVLAAIITAGIYIISHFKGKKIRETTDIYKALKGNADIYTAFSEIKEKIPNVIDVSLIQTTNGGGIPVPGSSIYIYIGPSTDPKQSTLFSSSRIPSDRFFNKVILQSIANTYDAYNVNDIENNIIGEYLKSKNITNICFFYTGIERGKKVVCLSIDFKNNYNITDDEKVFLRTQNVKIFRILKRYNKYIM